LRDPEAPSIAEEDVLNIRYSVYPMTLLNWDFDAEGIRASSESAEYSYAKISSMIPSEWMQKPLKNKVAVRTEPKISRNSPCPCGSNRKYKNCCIV